MREFKEAKLNKEKQKMKCPKCKEDIERLNFDVSAGCLSDISKDEIEAKEKHGFNILDYEIDALTEDVIFNNFCCPECEETLFNTQEEAIKFLKN